MRRRRLQGGGDLALQAGGYDPYDCAEDGAGVLP